MTTAALLAFLVVNGMAEHYLLEVNPDATESEKKSFLPKLRGDNAHLRITTDIANATKHAKQRPGRARTIEDIKVTDPRSAYGNPFWGYNVAGAYIGVAVFVEIEPGHSVEALSLLKQSTLYWANQVGYNEIFMASLDRFRTSP